MQRFLSVLSLCNGHNYEIRCELECDASTPSRQPSHIFQADQSRSCNLALGFYFTDALLSLFFPSSSSSTAASSVCSAKGCLALSARALSIHFLLCLPVPPHHDRIQSYSAKGGEQLFLSVWFPSVFIKPVYIMYLSTYKRNILHYFVLSLSL